MTLLGTDRLLLREFKESDWPHTYVYESDPETVRYQSFGPYSADESRAYIRRSIAAAQKVPRQTYDLAVVLRAEVRPIGRCGLHISNPELREGVLWYILNRAYWGHGYTTEAARALVKFGFVELKLHRIWADCDPANAASIRVLEKIGMRREAHLIENAYIKGAWCDSLIYAILDREWLIARMAEV